MLAGRNRLQNIQLFPIFRDIEKRGKVAKTVVVSQFSLRLWKIDYFACNLKKILALVLAFACAFTMFAGAAFTDQADIKATDAVNMLSALGVINGYDDGSYKPDATVTRAEMAKMIFVVRNNKIDDSAYKNNSTKLTDVNNHWAAGYIKFCESQGIIAGKGNNQFAPDATVTGVEAAKMLLVVSGYDAQKAGLTGSAWQTNVLKYAGAAGILDDVNSALESGLPRQYAAQMIYNTLDVNRVKWSKDSESFDDLLNGGVKETVGHAYMGLTKSTGTLVSISKDALTLANVDGAESDVISTSVSGGVVSYKYGTDFTKVGTDYSSLLGQKVKVLFKDGKTNSVLGVYPTSDNTVYNTVMNEVEKDGKKIKFDGKSYSIEDNGVKVYVDGDLMVKANKDVDLKKAADFDDAYTNATTGAALISGRLNRVSADEVIFVDSDDNGKIDTAIVTKVDVAKATYVSSSEIVAGNTTYKFADDNIASDIAKNDYVVITKNLYDDCNDIVKATKFSGVKVTGTKTEPNRYLIDGEWYTEGANADMNSVKSGDTVDAYAVNGVVYYAKRTSGENSTLSDVAVVLAVGSDIQGDKVKILKLDNTGKTEIVDIDNDPGTGYVAKNALQEGAAYEYSVKGGEYRFKNLSTDKDYFGDYTALNNGAVTSETAGMDVANKSGSTTKTIAGVQVDDSAKIILIDNYDDSNADYKVITGKQFKSLSIGNASKEAYAKGGIAAFTSKVDGVTRVTYGVVAVNGFASSFVTNDNYGYVTKAAYKIDGGYVVYSIWTGTEEVKVQEKGTTLRKKGAVLGYSSITKEDGLDDGVVGTIEDVDDNFGLVDNGIVYGVNAKQTKVSLNGKDTADITSDTVVLYVDTDDHKGYTEGEIQEADDFGTGKIPNVMYVLDNPSDFTSDVTLLVVDVKNNLHGDFNFVFGADAELTDVVNALAKADVVTVDAAAIDEEITVPAGKTLVLTGTVNADVLGNVKATAKATLKIASDTEAITSAAVYSDANTSLSNKIIKAGAVFNGTKKDDSAIWVVDDATKMLADAD